MQDEKNKTLFGKPVLFEKTFEGDGTTFSAHAEASAFLKEKGISQGSMERANPIALMKGGEPLPKWRYIDQEDMEVLDGVMTQNGGFREGTVTITLTIPLD